MAIVFIETYELPSINIREALRYAGVSSSNLDLEELRMRLDEAIALAEGKLTPRVCFCELDVSSCDFGCSLDIKKNLRNSQSVILFFFPAENGLDGMIS